MAIELGVQPETGGEVRRAISEARKFVTAACKCSTSQPLLGSEAVPLAASGPLGVALAMPAQGSDEIARSALSLAPVSGEEPGWAVRRSWQA